MSRLTDALRKLGSKLTGKSTVQSNSVATVLEDIANDYEGIHILKTSNITQLTTAEVEALKPGDIVLKKTGNMYHTYFVTYKEEHVGICISYFAAAYSETVSYDYTGGEWVYNSTDIYDPLHA